MNTFYSTSNQSLSQNRLVGYEPVQFSGAAATDATVVAIAAFVLEIDGAVVAFDVVAAVPIVAAIVVASAADSIMLVVVVAAVGPADDGAVVVLNCC